MTLLIGVERSFHNPAPAKSAAPSVARFSNPQNSVIFPRMDLRLTDEQQLLRRTIREFAEAEIRPHVMDVGRGPGVSDGPGAEAGRAWSDGHSGAGDATAAPGMSARRLLHLHRRARAGRSVDLPCRWPRTTAWRSRTCSMFGNEDAESSSISCRSRRASSWARWALTEASSGSDAAAMRTQARRGRRRLGAERHQAVHHARRHRRTRWSSWR